MFLLVAETEAAEAAFREATLAPPTSSFAPIYHWFTEGFDTADLKDAKALLEDLSH